MKKILIMLLILVTAITLSGCYVDDVKNRESKLYNFEALTSEDSYFLNFTIAESNYTTKISKTLYEKVKAKEDIAYIVASYSCDENPLTQNQINAYNFSFYIVYK